MSRSTYFWFIVVRIIAALWIASGVLTLILAVVPWLLTPLITSLGSWAGFVFSFGMTVDMLWGIAGALFNGFIGYFIWRTDENYRASMGFLCVIILIFAAFSLDILRAGFLIITILVLFHPSAQRAFIPGGRNTKFFGLEKLFVRRRRW
ncbi:hypothetical protein J7K50_05205 [bacterium]|nr:hypothetical protein [bacterium]